MTSDMINANDLLLFRFHKGGLKESMETTIVIPSKASLDKYITKTMGIYITDIETEPYCYDDRIGWDTYLVTGAFNGNDRLRFTIGYLNRDPNW